MRESSFFTSRNFIGVVAGLCALLVLDILRIFMTILFARLMEPLKFQSLSPIFGYLGILALFIATTVTGWIVRKKGWIYGGLVGFTVPLLSLTGRIVVVSIKSLASYVYGPAAKSVSVKITVNTFLPLLLPAFIGVLGGFFGQKLYEKISLRAKKTSLVK